MHVIQYVATKSDTPENAHSSVKQYLEAHLGSEDYPSDVWYDWFITGGGRWASGDDNQYNDSYVDDVTHQSQPEFQENIDKAKKFRKTEIQENLEAARKLDITKLLDSIDSDSEFNFGAAIELYPIKKLYDISWGSWDHSSYFFDIENDTTSTKYMLEAIDKGDDDWYIVPVDFHF